MSEGADSDERADYFKMMNRVNDVKAHTKRLSNLAVLAKQNLRKSKKDRQELANEELDPRNLVQKYAINMKDFDLWERAKQLENEDAERILALEEKAAKEAGQNYRLDALS